MTQERLETLAERCEVAASAFEALGYTAQFEAITDAVSLEWGGTAIAASPRKFIESLKKRAAALRARQALSQERAS